MSNRRQTATQRQHRALEVAIRAPKGPDGCRDPKLMRRLGWTMVEDTDEVRIWVRPQVDVDPAPAAFFFDATSLSH